MARFCPKCGEPTLSLNTSGYECQNCGTSGDLNDLARLAAEFDFKTGKRVDETFSSPGVVEAVVGAGKRLGKTLSSPGGSGKKRKGGMCPKCGEKSATITGQRYVCKKCGASGSTDEIIKKLAEENADRYQVAIKIALVHKEARKHLDANDREAAINIIASALGLSRADAEQMVVNIETEDQQKVSASQSGCAGVLLVVATFVSGLYFLF